MPFRAVVLPAGALLSIFTGLLLRVVDTPESAARLWSAGLVLTGVPVVWATLRGLLSRRFAADVVAMLAIVTALLLGEPLAGLIVVLMQTGGEALERYAEGRASAAVRELEASAPRVAHLVGSGETVDVEAGAVIVGDVLLVRPGELVPCDGPVLEGTSHVDTARITGEPTPVSAGPGTSLLSGSLNLDGPLTMRASAAASESQYATIVELVRVAQESKSPFQRLADRYAVWFTPFTLLVCLLAYLMTGDPVRVLAVLVVATPCPLILAVPVAIIGGINLAARHGIIFRHGSALEQLASVDVAVLDKTGTLTIGRPRVDRVVVVPPFTEPDLLRLVGGVEHGSGHLLARTVSEEIASRGIAPAEAREITEQPGEGVTGLVNGRRVTIGAWSYVLKQHPKAEDGLRSALADTEGSALRSYIAVDGLGAGMVEYADRIRPGIPAFLETLRRLGIRRIALLSGDAPAHAAAVGKALGMDEAHGGLLPADKVEFVRRLGAEGSRVLMVGDGTNDAPALSSAAVGIALASGGGGIAAEAADAVILADDPTRIAEAIVISRRTLGLARQSVWVGLGLSGTAMIAASLGYITPIAGALLQEGIDVAVILNALRASRTGPQRPLNQRAPVTGRYIPRPPDSGRP